MSQRLIIHQFGPITDIDIEVKDILVFIGSQASGKSTVSKAIFFFKSLKDDLYRYYLDCYNQNKFDSSISNFAKLAKQKFIKIYGSVQQSPDMRLEYDYRNGIKICIYHSQDNPQDNRFMNIEFSEKFTNRFKKIMNKFEDLYDELHPNPYVFPSSREISMIKSREAALFEYTGTELNWLFRDDRDIVFLPAGRSLITTLSQQRYNIEMGDESLSNGEIESDGLTKLDYLMQNFIARIDQAKLIFEQGLDKLLEQHISDSDSNSIQTINLAQNLVNLILRGSYSSFKGIERIAFADGKSTLINFASSGQQEVVWILLLIVLLIINNRKVFLVVEEPEAHLFPVAQKQIIDLIALLANQNDNQILLTTHSPYILSSFNNLLYAHKIGMDKVEEVTAVVDPHLWIRSSRLDAYILEDGTARTIVDREVGLIQSAEIDRASNIIVDTFNQLFDLED
jgi:predicted ATP-dependent endonuclease of OLD family